MKFIVYLLTLLFVGTAIAQNPTILQGNYITNVFGNSNFVLNPNAQTNTANVTVSNATVTRSTTTPLVATSEFTITTSTATGYADWALRTFDQGMKNNNCEARFTYRGFSVGTTTAQILQGTNVVAQLALTASTDPRIASINFPCGDLSAVTKLRFQQATASLTGTNEISGIYVGLATNMANVAQAENVVFAYRASTQSIPTATDTKVEFDTETFDVYGEFTTSGADIGVFTAKRAGNYQVTANALFALDSWTANKEIYFVVKKNGSAICATTKRIEATITTYFMPLPITCNIPVAVGDKLRADIYQDNGTNRNLFGGQPYTTFQVSRFPSSSELVVTPERQAWYISGYHTGALPDLGNANQVSRTEITNGSLTLVPDAGSQPVATLCASGNNPPALSTTSTTCAAGNESVGLTFNIPSVGSYEVCSQFSSNVSTAAASSIDMAFSLEETTTTSSTPLTTNKGNARYATVDSSASNTAMPFRHCQIMTFNSVGQKAVRLMYRQAVTGTIFQNYVLADDARGRAIMWSVKPVTNQSNSALYVQGPVLGAQTGAAIPAGYVGQEISAEQNSFTSGLVNGSTVGFLSITLTPGTWLISASQSVVQNGSTGTAVSSVMSDVSATGNTITGVGASVNDLGNWPPNNITQSSITHPSFIYSTSTSKTIYLNSYSVFSAGTPLRRGTLRAVRLN